MDKDDLLDAVYDRVERELTLLGATAVEDKLQDEVRETITVLKQAGIKIWMMTGDKFETAENVAISCQLIDPFADFVVRLKSSSDLYSLNWDSIPGSCLIVEGAIVESILGDSYLS